MSLERGRARSPSAPCDGGDREGGRLGEPSLPQAGLPQRKPLPHEIPPWVAEDALYFVTLCARPRGLNQLCRPEVAARLRESVIHRQEQGQWWVVRFLLMPDHVHMLAGFASDPGMGRIIGDWKRYTARNLGIRWQRDFFEHRLRRDESLAEKAEYIRQNPVRAGLIADPDDWPYGWDLTG